MRLATVFSGIGSIEFALHRMGIQYDIVFACDNGDVELNLLEGEDLVNYSRLKKLRSKKQLKEQKDIEELITLSRLEDKKAEEIREKVCNLDSKKEKKFAQPP